MNDSLLFGALVVLVIIICYLAVAIRRYTKEKNRQKEVARRRRISSRVKQSVLERDEYTCQICGISREFCESLYPGLGEYLLLEIDHIISIANGGTSEYDNLQTLCWRCNRKKGGRKTNEQVRKMIRDVHF